jgi:ArsR family transcriptional regulator, arsenate/arsenite/antimonite-responsive transcriptional repressor
MQANTPTPTKTYDLTEEDVRLVQLMKALAHPARMQVVRYLMDNPACITGDLVDALPLAQATVSQHLKVLREAGIITGTIDGPAVCYCLDRETVAWLRERVAALFADSCCG